VRTNGTELPRKGGKTRINTKTLNCGEGGILKTCRVQRFGYEYRVQPTRACSTETKKGGRKKKKRGYLMPYCQSAELRSSQRSGVLGNSRIPVGSSSGERGEELKFFQMSAIFVRRTLRKRAGE